jgi:hypothetical protein
MLSDFVWIYLQEIWIGFDYNKNHDFGTSSKIYGPAKMA